MTPAGSAPTDLVVIKLGGSLITDKQRPQTLRPKVLKRLATEIAESRSSLPGGLLVGHGSGSFGHVAAKTAGLGRNPFCPPGQPAEAAQRTGLSETLRQARRLHHRVIEALADAGAEPWSWAPSSAATARAGRLARGNIEPLAHALDLGLTPVVYGDVVADVAWGAVIASTEDVVRFVEPRLGRRGYRVSRVLWCGETRGIYDAEGTTLPNIALDDLRRVRRAIQGAAGTDVTGGMRLRLDTTVALARRGVTSVILDGTDPGALAAALRGEAVPGSTTVSPDGLV